VGLVKGPDGGIAGVHSLSEAPPLKSAGFAVRDKEFEEKTKYSDWKFIYSPATAPGIKPPPPAAKAEKT
jgi:hypothetical protein